MLPADRFIYWFILGWVILIAVLILLDWLGDPNRGGFRPKGDRESPDRMTRRAERRRQRLEEDAAVRATLRDAYGSSSLRFSWDREQETRARELDDALIVSDLVPDAVDAPSREVADPDPEPESDSERDSGAEPDSDSLDEDR